MQVKALIGSATSDLYPSESARLDSEIMLAMVLGVDRAALYARANEVVSTAYIRAFKHLLLQRAAGYPIAYILGIKEFWSLDLKVNRHTLIPRPETEGLVEAALALLAGSTCPRILELGTGSGAIALAMATERPDSQIIATDDDPAALAVARLNAQENGIANICFLSCHWFQALRPMQVDMVISNPPYIASNDRYLVQDGLRFEPQHALVGGKDGLEALAHIIRNADYYLADTGVLIVEHGYDQGCAVHALFQAHRYHLIKTIQDYAGLDRVSYAYKQPEKG